MLQRLTRWRLSEYLMLFQALIYSWLFRLALWVLPFKSVITLARRLPRPGPEPHKDAAQRVARAVTRAARLTPSSTCLVQSLACLALLKSADGSAHLSIGVAKGSEFGAHAWLEWRGEALIGGPTSSQFVELLRIT